MRSAALFTVAIVAASAISACKKTGEGEYQVKTPDVSVTTDSTTIKTPSVQMGTDTTNVVTPTVKVGTDTHRVVTPKVKVTTP